MNGQTPADVWQVAFQRAVLIGLPTGLSAGATVWLTTMKLGAAIATGIVAFCAVQLVRGAAEGYVDTRPLKS